ncbi:protein translocase subunit SecF [Vibrio crassostreae]|uniref:protein translocase subunit SecF n=1 Tax=Vibrio crassostreae TaxID=246167 RepID=UPI001B30D70A|nr:protein translocase subunit SecF [Vibrio crassostreae]
MTAEKFLLNNRKTLFFFSLAVFLASLIIGFVMKPNYGVEFAGGYIIETSADLPKGANELLEGDLADVLIEVDKREEGQTIKLTTKTTQVELEGFKSAMGESLLSVDSISGSYGEEMQSNSFKAVVAAMLAMTLYLAIRYNTIMAGATMVALIHDLVIALGFVVFFGIEINTMTVGALMTIIGYSVNDSVVTLDKLKELLRKKAESPVLKAIKLVLPRSLITSKSTILVLISLLMLGGEAVRGFALVMAIGVVFGTLSSLVVVTSLIEKAAKNKPSVFEIPEKPSIDGDV